MPLPVVALAAVLVAPAVAAAQSSSSPPVLELSRSGGSAAPLVGAVQTFQGDLEAYGRGSGQRVVLEADPFPFDGAFSAVAETVTDEGGRFGFSQSPTTNTRFRAVAPELPEAPVSKVLEHVVELGHQLHVRNRERRPSIVIALRGPRSAVDGRRLSVYRFAYRRTVGRRVATVRMRSTSDSRAVGRARLRLSRVRLGDGMLVCLHEPVDDGIGVHSLRQRRCGRPTTSASGGDPGLGILLTDLLGR